MLFLGKEGDHHTDKALSFLIDNFSDVNVRLGGFGDGKVDYDFGGWEGEMIISYLSPWIVPEHLLSRARLWAINFHPAPPEYPGIGCYNFALYDNSPMYGVTCHHMAQQVDTGNIVAVKRFPVYQTDTVAKLISRTQDYQLSFFYDIMNMVICGAGLPSSQERWLRPPYTRKELNKLSQITLDMSTGEIERRVRATTFGKWRPTIHAGRFTFELK